MELAQYQTQIALSLIVILAAALVALVCDLLKGNNEQLRELAIELKVRREEENKRFQTLAPHAVAAPAAVMATAKAAPQIEETAAAVRPVAAAVAKRPAREKRAMAPEVLAAIQRGEQLAAAPTSNRAPDRVPAKRSAVEQMLIQRNERAAKAPVIDVMQAASAPAAVANEVSAAAPSLVATAKPAGASRDWGSLLNSHRPRTAANPGRNEDQARLLDAVVAATTSGASTASEPALPAGFQDGFVLTRLVESRQPVSGLVVSIGASVGQDANHSLPENVRALIQSLIGPNDFAAQSGKDEFLLIYPGERGASAQRRLSQIAEQLWDFQLRSMGALSILFSWGGVEVRSESIDEAIASATERMQETRRARKVFTMEPRPQTETPLRRAV